MLIVGLNFIGRALTHSQRIDSLWKVPQRARDCQVRLGCRQKPLSLTVADPVQVAAFVLFDLLFCQRIELRNVEFALENRAKQFCSRTWHTGLTRDLHKRRLELRHFLLLGWRGGLVFICEQVGVNIDEVHHLWSRCLVLHRVDLLPAISSLREWSIFLAYAVEVLHVRRLWVLIKFWL